MKSVLEPVSAGNRSLGSLVVARARQHLKQHPREVGGQNMGPWVRLYTGGRQGPDWPWCAAFVSFILKQACRDKGVRPPIQTSVSCDTLAANARAKGIFLSERDLQQPSQVGAGSVFLNRRTPTDWTHTGIAVKAAKDVFVTIEGNTNDDGHREGYEVCERVRGYARKDFIVI
jgi:hypothetical protein